jgi:hypothetical protein
MAGWTLDTQKGVCKAMTEASRCSVSLLKLGHCSSSRECAWPVFLDVVCGASMARQQSLSRLVTLVLYVLGLCVWAGEAAPRGGGHRGEAAVLDADRMAAMRAHLETEMLTDGTVHSLLDIESRSRAGKLTPTDKAKEVALARRKIAGKVAAHLLESSVRVVDAPQREHAFIQTGDQRGAPESGIDTPSDKCQDKMDKWMKECVFVTDN